MLALFGLRRIHDRLAFPWCRSDAAAVAGIPAADSSCPRWKRGRLIAVGGAEGLWRLLHPCKSFFGART